MQVLASIWVGGGFIRTTRWVSAFARTSNLPFVKITSDSNYYITLSGSLVVGRPQSLAGNYTVQVKATNGPMFYHNFLVETDGDPRKIADFKMLYSPRDLTYVHGRAHSFSLHSRETQSNFSVLRSIFISSTTFSPVRNTRFWMCALGRDKESTDHPVVFKWRSFGQWYKRGSYWKQGSSIDLDECERALCRRCPRSYCFLPSNQLNKWSRGNCKIGYDRSV